MTNGPGRLLLGFANSPSVTSIRRLFHKPHQGVLKNNRRYEYDLPDLRSPESGGCKDRINAAVNDRAASILVCGTSSAAL